VVVDGTNSFFPGDNVGWMGAWFFGGNAEYTKSARIFGYPGQRTSSCGNGGSLLTCNTRLWGHERTGSGIDTTNAYQVEYTHDTSGGQSGAAYWYDYLGNAAAPTVLAIHKGEQTASLNWGRRLDSTVWSFVQTYSDDF
jgi:hypothetical protein